MIVGGLISGYVPVVFLTEIGTIGGRYALVLGLLYPVLISLTGLLVLLRPELASVLGAVGIVLSVLSVIGALGGIAIGFVLSFLGAVLCILWDVVTGLFGGHVET